MERNFVCEINDQDSQDAMQDSLTEEAKSLLSTHKPTQVNIFQNESTPLDYQNSASTPNTIKRTRSVSSDATPVATAFSEGTLSLPHRRAYLNIAETKEENKKLKAEVFDLKSQYLTMQTELDNEKVRRVEMEQMWHSQKKKFDEERLKFESERNDWEKERERLLLDR
ncbi:unnamed protein product, partial [Onchocerca ochengi]|uniref:CCDC6 n=1 Tax=Onchocerca ochengi TaxID=42157 RepID=A0A182EVK4_ONCOC